MTNPEGRLLLRRRAVDPPPDVRSDLQIWRGIADRLGRGSFFPTDPEEVFDRAAAGQRGRDRRLRRDHLRAPGRGRGAVLAVPGRGPPRHPAHVRRPLRHAGRARQLRRGPAPARRRTARRGAPVPADHRPRPLAVPVGHADPAQPDARRGRPAPVRRAAPRAGPRGTASPTATPCAWPPRAAARCSTPGSIRGIRPDTVFVPFHWGGAACVNALTSDALDPTSRMPEFKTCPVAVGRRREGGLPIEQNGVAAQVAVRT